MASLPSMGAPPPDLDLLTAQQGWVRRLARRLVGRDEADDLVQDTFVAALRRPPREGGDERVLRAWLSRVLTRGAASRARAHARREARERAHARPESVEDPAVHLAGTSRRLVAAVMALEEPARSAILLRYVEGRTYEQIAASTGVSPAAVRKRVSRAIARMRARLDSEHGGRRAAWTSAVGAWLAGEEISATTAAPAAFVGGLAVSAKLGLALLVAVVTAGVLFRLSSTEGAATPAEQRATERVAAVLTGERDDGADRDESSARAAVVAAPTSPRMTPTTDARFTGRVTDVAGRPIADATVEFILGGDVALRTTTSHGGAYVVNLAELPPISSHLPNGLEAYLTVDAPGYRSQRQRGKLNGSPLTGRLNFVLEEGFELVGRVVDAQGRPCAARVHSFVGTRRDEVRAGDDGRFCLPLPARTGLRVTAQHAAHGFVSAGPFDAPAGRDLDVGDLVLVARERLAGVVVTPQGDPVPGLLVHAIPGEPDTEAEPAIVDVTQRAWVRSEPDPDLFDRYWELPGMPSGSVKTDARGQFSFEALGPGSYVLSTSSPFGFESYRHGVFDTGAFARLVRDHRVLVVRVVDDEGFPLHGAIVNVAGEEWMTSDVVSAPHAVHEAEVTVGHWTVAVGTAGAATWTCAVEVTESTYRVELTAVVDLSPETGAIDLRVADEDGAPLPDARVLLSPVTEGWEASWTFRPGPQVPVGAYRARVTMGGYGRVLWFDELVPVTIHADETTLLEVTLRRGARIDLVVQAPGQYAGEGPAPARRIELDRGGVAEELSFRSTLDMLSPGRGFEETGFFDTPLTSELVEPGTCTLRIDVEGYVPFEQIVTLRAGEVESIRVELAPR